MTPAPNPTAERLREMVANLIPLDLIHDRGRPGQPQDAFEAADRIIDALRAHGFLSGGAPSEEQVADDDLPDEHLPNQAYKVGRKIAERGDFNGLDAATVFMRGAVYGVRKLAPLDPEKVAEWLKEQGL